MSARLKEQSVSTKIPDHPILESQIEQQGWQAYHPPACGRFEEQLGPLEYNKDQTEPYRDQTSKITLPGAPPEIYEEWNEPIERDEEVRPRAQPSVRSNSGDGDVLHSIYGGEELPLFGPQYGMLNPSGIRPQKLIAVETSNIYEGWNSYIEYERAYLEGLKSSKGHGTQTNSSNTRKSLPPLISPTAALERTEASTETFTPPKTGPSSCIICVEDFSETIRPPGWISSACLHEPSVCSPCLSKCIKSDLENKIWNQIKCPECKTLLIYDDIKRLADPETFSRYEEMSFRSAVSEDSNFVWCRGCDFGQLHESGASQPIIRCLNCGFRSCFVHSVPWNEHEQLTCEEYDEMLRDPDGFKSARDKEDESNEAARKQQQEDDEKFARELSQRDKQAEQDRQRERHAEERRRAEAQQKAEAAKKKLEQEQEQAKKREELKKRQREEQLSMAAVDSTTKKCPGCHSPIQKNEGCDHMTCTKCRHEFCWRCMKPWRGRGYSKCRC